MAYTNAQKKQHIKEVQTYLYAISFFNSNIPVIIPDGFYGKETQLAVIAFQREYNLPETGSVDSATWNKIVSVYRSYQKWNPVAYDIFPSADYVMKQGDSGTLVYIIQIMLSDLATHFDNMPDVPVDGNFGSETFEAVKLFQQRVGLLQNGAVNSNTWNMMVRASEHVNKML